MHERGRTLERARGLKCSQVVGGDARIDKADLGWLSGRLFTKITELLHEPGERKNSRKILL